MNADARRAAGGRELDHRVDLPLVAVHSAGREKTEHVQRRAARAGRLDGADERRIARELSRFDRAVDSRVVLVDDAAGADVEMPDFRISHLSARQAHGELGGVDGRVRARRQELVPVRLLRAGDGVVGCRLAAAEAVEDHERDGTPREADGSGHGRLAKWDATLCKRHA